MEYLFYYTSYYLFLFKYKNLVLEILKKFEIIIHREIRSNCFQLFVNVIVIKAN